MMSMAMMTSHNLLERAPDQHARASRRLGVTPSTGIGFNDNSEIQNSINYLQNLLLGRLIISQSITIKYTLKRYTVEKRLKKVHTKILCKHKLLKLIFF